MNRMTAGEPGIKLGARFHSTRITTSAQEWVSQQEDPAAILEREVANWLKDLVEQEALFKKYVYDNTELTDADMRQHRARICQAVSNGDFLILALALLGEQTGNQEEVKAVISLLDQKVKKLFDTLLAWHAPLATQPDVPESFKCAARDIQEGNIVDLDI